MHKTAQPLPAVLRGKITLQLAVLVLLLANAAFLGWMQYGAVIGAKSTEAHLIEQQINRDAVHLLTPQQVAALAEQQGTGTVKVAGTGNSTAPGACLEWGAFNAADVAKADEALAALGVNASFGRVVVSTHSGGYRAAAAAALVGWGGPSRSPVQEMWLFDSL